MISTKLIASTKEHEGRRLRAYQDSEGVWTIGYGTNLQELEITEPLANEWLLLKLMQAQVSAKGYPWYAGLDAARQDVVVEMLYNLGLTRFDKFKKMIAAVAAKDYLTASREMLDSTWAKQVGVRAIRLAAQMETGVYWK